MVTYLTQEAAVINVLVKTLAWLVCFTVFAFGCVCRNTFTICYGSKKSLSHVVLEYIADLLII